MGNVPALLLAYVVLVGVIALPILASWVLVGRKK